VTEPDAQSWIVVGVDHSPAARRAAGWAAELAPLLGARVSAVHGLGLLESLGGALVPGHAHRAEIEAVAEREWCAPLADAGVAFRVNVREQPAIDALVGEIGDLGAELAVVGTRGAGLPDDQAMGSTALHLLQEATVPVLVVPAAGGEPAPALKRLVVGNDDRPESEAAMRWALALADRCGAECDVVSLPPDPLDELAEALVARADELGADLVVLGASGRGAEGDPLVGSVSRHVAHRSARAVVVVR
jgi:nucleotide-binding universal stress UspA family protein